MNHFPLFHHAYQLDVQHIWKYVTIFRKHVIRTQNMNPYMFTSYHEYDDGLTFIIKWNVFDLKSKNGNPRIPPIIPLQTLCDLLDNGKISLHYGCVHKHSSQSTRSMPNKEAVEKFQSEFSHAKLAISPELYQKLEFSPTIVHTIRNSQIVEIVNQYRTFEKYLKDNGHI